MPEEKIIQDYETWKKQAEGIFGKEFYNEGEVIKIPSVIKRCPKCHKLSLEYDVRNGRIYCSNCEFELKIPVTKNES